MTWVKPAMIVATCAIALASSGAALAAIVVASTGPSAKQFPAGKKLDDNQTIILQAGDSVTVLDPRGTRVLRGAGTFKASDTAGQNRSSTFTALTRQRGSQRVRTGAVRNAGPDGKLMSPNLWFVDLSKSGTICVVGGSPVHVWRPEAAKAANYRVANTAGATSTLSFDAGSMVAPWNATATPISDGSTFTVTTEAGQPLGRYGFVVLPSQPATPEDTAAALIEKGCAAQLELLSASLATQG
ncbi:MAG: hypothetical protein ABWZ75_09435 [Novosphingobium sp.]